MIRRGVKEATTLDTMNRNLDGTPLTNDFLVSLVVAGSRAHPPMTLEDVNARMSALHNKSIIRSWLIDMTQDVRFEMLGRGQLKLDTRTAKNSSVS